MYTICNFHSIEKRVYFHYLKFSFLNSKAGKGKLESFEIKEVFFNCEKIRPIRFGSEFSLSLFFCQLTRALSPLFLLSRSRDK